MRHIADVSMGVSFQYNFPVSMHHKTWKWSEVQVYFGAVDLG